MKRNWLKSKVHGIKTRIMGGWDAEGKATVLHRKGTPCVCYTYTEHARARTRLDSDTYTRKGWPPER